MSLALEPTTTASMERHPDINCQVTYDDIISIKRMLSREATKIWEINQKLDFSEEKGKANDILLSSALISISDLQSENKELKEIVKTLAGQVHRLQLATSKRCKICDVEFIPTKPHHDKCKQCNLAKTTISCKKCKKLFLQSHHTHKYCSICI